MAQFFWLTVYMSIAVRNNGLYRGHDCRMATLVVQLQAKFESLKKQHTDDKKKLEDKRRLLDEQMNSFEQRKVHTLTSSQQALGGPKKKK